jgi:hypothetical protein
MNNAAEPGMAQLHLELRRARLLDSVSRPLEPVAAGGDPLPPDRVQYLLREAQDLYWNELAWEELMEEEAVVGGRLTELVFPAFLAFVDGLLLDRLPRGVPGTPRPRRRWSRRSSSSSPSGTPSPPTSSGTGPTRSGSSGPAP